MTDALEAVIHLNDGIRIEASSESGQARASISRDLVRAALDRSLKCCLTRCVGLENNGKVSLRFE